MGLVMFDYDGVIVDSFDLVASDFIKACHHNGFYGIQSREDLALLSEDNVYESMMKQGLSTETINKILRDYENYSRKRLNEARVFDGMAGAIKKIASKNRVVVITSNISENVREVLKRHGIEEVEEVIGADREKSKIKKIRQAMKSYPAAKSYYVGDTTGDMIEGKKAGAITIGVAWGWHGATKLKGCAPDHLVYSPAELVALLC